MSREKLMEARKLIEAKRYEEGAAILRTLPNDPAAQKWLAQLEMKGVVPPASAGNELAALRAGLVNPLEHQKSHSLFPVFVGVALMLIAALQAVMIVALVRDRGPVEIEQPVSVHGTVSVEADETDEQAPGVLVVEQSVQQWEYLYMVYSQSMQMPIVATKDNDAGHDLAVRLLDLRDTLDVENDILLPYFLTVLGEDGWEVVGFKDAPNTLEFVFKRPIT